MLIEVQYIHTYVNISTIQNIKIRDLIILNMLSF